MRIDEFIAGEGDYCFDTEQGIGGWIVTGALTLISSLIVFVVALVIMKLWGLV